MSMTEEKNEILPPGRWQHIKQEYRKSLSATIRSRAAWFFVALQLAAFVILILKGRFDVFLNVMPVTAFVIVLSLLTIPLTSGVDQLPPVETRCSRPQLWWQIALLLLVILLIVYRGIVLTMPGALQIPLLFPLANWSFSFLGPHSTALDNWIAVPVLYFLIPIVLLLLTGARWSELGLGRGYHGWRVTLLWCILPLITIIVLLTIGAASFMRLIVNGLGNVFQNGFFEEFLFRGALMTRLSYLLHSDWGLVLSILIFGLSHIGVQTSLLHGDWLVGAADVIIDQAVIGLGMAIIFLRTRNLLASSIFHVILDTI